MLFDVSLQRTFNIVDPLYNQNCYSRNIDETTIFTLVYFQNIYIYTSRYKKKSLELNSYEFVITEIFNQRIAEAKAEMQDKKAGKKNKGLLKILMP